jgi:hypothetical protein
MDFITDQTENVFPMVPGQGLTEMILAEELWRRRTVPRRSPPLGVT